MANSSFSSSKSKNFKGESAEETTRRTTIKYRECWRNHAILIGGYAVDGCGEFIPKGDQGTKEALLCEACDCHRNFHRKEWIENGATLLYSHHTSTPPPMWSPQPSISPHRHHYYSPDEVQDMASDEESVIYSGSQGAMEMKTGKRTKR